MRKLRGDGIERRHFEGNFLGSVVLLACVCCAKCVCRVCDGACHERLGQARAPVAAGEDGILVCPCYKMFEDVAHVSHVSIADDFT